MTKLSIGFSPCPNDTFIFDALIHGKIDTEGLEPIPLGGIAIKRNLDKSLQEKVQRLIRKSLEFAFEYPAESLGFVKQHAQEMDAEVMQKHINLYVNDYSLSLGKKGKEAIQYMYDFSVNENLIVETVQGLFV